MSEKSSVPIKRELHLELENLNLKLHIMKRNVADAERKFQERVEAVFAAEGKIKDDWALDLDRGFFVSKNVKLAGDVKSSE